MITLTKKDRKSKLNADECGQLVLAFFQKQRKFKKIQSQFDELKARFYNDLEDYFECNCGDAKSKIDFSYVNCSEGDLTVKRVQKSNVIFDPVKLEKALGKQLSENIILKRYEIVDMTGLIAYLKECGVDPRVFKSFVHVSKTVDTKELDRLEELGKITAKQVQGCYTIKSQKPYFTVNVRKGHDNDE